MESTFLFRGCTATLSPTLFSCGGHSFGNDNNNVPRKSLSALSPKIDAIRLWAQGIIASQCPEGKRKSFISRPTKNARFVELVVEVVFGQINRQEQRATAIEVDLLDQ